MNAALWLLLGVLIGALAAGAALRRRPAAPPPAPPAPAPLDASRGRESGGSTETWRQLRHDLRGALSPAMLATDRLAESADPAVARAGTLILRSLDRALEILKEERGGA